MDDFSGRPAVKKRLPTKQADYSYNFDSVDVEELVAQFPLPRYFQIHFSHVHENCEQVKKQFNELSQRVDKIEQKLDKLLDIMAQEQI